MRLGGGFVMKRILGIALVCMVVALTATAVFATTGTSNAWLKNPILRLWNAIHELQAQVSSISTTPGEPGPQGPTGECSCGLTATDFQALTARVEQLEAGGQSPEYLPDCLIDSDCDDNNACTDEACNPVLGCVFTNNNNACDDGNPDTINDACSASVCSGTITGGSSSSEELLVSEIMYNPNAVTDTYGEWIELYNPGADDINLNGWSIKDHGTDHFAITEDFFVPAGSYAVLCKNTDSALNGGVVCDYGYTSFALGNTADAVILVAPDSTVIDEVSYDTALEPWNSFDQAGYSLQLDPGLESWCKAFEPIGSGDYGTPGYANSNCNAG
jgi:hypothetical protein